MTSISGRSTASALAYQRLRNDKISGPREVATWQRLSQASKAVEGNPASPDAPIFQFEKRVAAAKAPLAADIAPLSNIPPEQLLAKFSRIELLLDRAVAASQGQRPELELGRTAIAQHVRRMMLVQAGRDSLVGGT